MNNSQRKLCWKLRDLLYKCQEKNDEDNSKCTQELEELYKSCPISWVKRYENRREFLLKRGKETRFIPEEEEKE
ncbi:hypothetical protein AKO1_011199 [Acrasis kona]|uniref:Cytochrome c oxidase assembly factor 6 n=1 Tax=Acrasis kona TaxID=1008807 RepID=A0AAW2YWH3_9EUKA